MIAYADASVILRVILAADDQLREWTELDAIVASQLVGTECRRSLHRLRLANRISDENLVAALTAVGALLSEVDLVQVDTAVLTRAGDAFPTALGTLDSIHLVTALLWEQHQGEPLDAFLTHDVELGRAARAMGLRVLGCG